MKPLIEILTFEGCPNREGAVALVERVSVELGLEPELRVIDVPDPDAAERERFLGSRTIRVNGRDVEPGAGERTDYVLACRVYRTVQGPSGQPDEQWLRDALQRAA
jgi:hypothetical protein